MKFKQNEIMKLEIKHPKETLIFAILFGLIFLIFGLIFEFKIVDINNLNVFIYSIIPQKHHEFIKNKFHYFFIFLGVLIILPSLKRLLFPKSFIVATDQGLYLAVLFSGNLFIPWVSVREINKKKILRPLSGSRRYAEGLSIKIEPTFKLPLLLRDVAPSEKNEINFLSEYLDAPLDKIVSILNDLRIKNKNTDSGESLSAY